MGRYQQVGLPNALAPGLQGSGTPERMQGKAVMMACCSIHHRLASLEPSPRPVSKQAQEQTTGLLQRHAWAASGLNGQ